MALKDGSGTHKCDMSTFSVSARLSINQFFHATKRPSAVCHVGSRVAGQGEKYGAKLPVSIQPLPSFQKASHHCERERARERERETKVYR